MPLQIRRGTDAERLAMTQPLAQGELLFVSTLGAERLYIGNGSTLGGVQITGYTNADAKDAAAASFIGGTHSGITFTYNTTTDLINATVDLSNYQGTLRADAFKGSVFADDSTLLVDAVSGTIVGPVIGNVTGNVTGNVIGNITGNVVGNTTGFHTGDVKGSVFADDSTLLVDAVSGTIVGPVIGNVTGNVTGNVIGNVIGNVTGNVIGNITGVITGTAGSTITGNLIGNVTGNTTGTLTGTVRLSDSTAIIDDEGNINANEFVGSTVILSGRNNSNIPAGIRIETDSEFFDGFDLVTTITANNGVGGQLHRHIRSRGTIAAPAALVNGDSISTIVFIGSDGVSASGKPTHFLNVSVDNTVTAGNIPTRMVLGYFNSSENPEATLTFGTDHVLNLNTVTNIAAGGASGQVNLGGGVLGYLKVQVGATAFGIPMYGINP
jgi:F0F1-type ATP synthase assembly protein I